VWDVNKQLFAVILSMAAGFSYKEGSHVCVDIIISRWAPRTQAWVNIFTFPVFAVFAGVLVWTLGHMAVKAVTIRETMSTVFAPPIYPLKVIVVIGIAIFILQGIAGFMSNIMLLIGHKTGH
jgi:TRAP-type mannitol/chloroaromatic compound transport system permease small subunit